MEMKNFRFVQVEDSVSDQCMEPEQHERCDPDKTVTLEHSDKDGGSAEESRMGQGECLVEVLF